MMCRASFPHAYWDAQMCLRALIHPCVGGTALKTLIWDALVGCFAYASARPEFIRLPRSGSDLSCF